MWPMWVEKSHFSVSYIVADMFFHKNIETLWSFSTRMPPGRTILHANANSKKLLIMSEKWIGHKSHKSLNFIYNRILIDQNLTYIFKKHHFWHFPFYFITFQFSLMQKFDMQKENRRLKNSKLIWCATDPCVDRLNIRPIELCATGHVTLLLAQPGQLAVTNEH